MDTATRAHRGVGWIAAGALAACAGIAAADAPASSDSSQAAAAPAAPAARAVAAQPNGSESARREASAIAAASSEVAAAPRAQLPPGQVWQCVVEGQRIFSDAPCGANASIRHLKDLNVMDPVPVAPAPAYGYGYPAPYASAPYAPAPETADVEPDYSYGGPEVVSVYGRAHRYYFPRHDAHVRPHPHPQPRRN